MILVESLGAGVAVLNLGVIWYYSAHLKRLAKDAHKSQVAWNVAVEAAPLRFLAAQVSRLEGLAGVLKSGTKLHNRWDHEIIALDRAVSEVLCRTSFADTAAAAMADLGKRVRAVSDAVDAENLVGICEQFESVAQKTHEAIGRRLKELDASRDALGNRVG